MVFCFLWDKFRFLLRDGSMWLTSPAFNTHTTLFAFKNMQKITFQSSTTIATYTTAINVVADVNNNNNNIY
jgi:hypothetical protein